MTSATSPPAAGPQTFEQALAAEYAALRPGEAGEEPALAVLHRAAHRFRQPLRALCFSGGGIRSATFNLGVLQGLAEAGALDQFDYLSTVSGGGYIGGWLAAWVRRAGGLEHVLPGLRPNAAPRGAGPGQDPIGHLRGYNNYLTPRLGAMSVDTWTVIVTVARNIFLNWLVFIPLLLAALMLPRWMVTLANADAWNVPAPVSAGLPWLAGALLTFGLWNILRNFPAMGNANEGQPSFDWKVLAPLALAAVLWSASEALANYSGGQGGSAPLGAALAWALLPCLGAWVLYLATCGGSLRARAKLAAGPVTLALALQGLGTGAAVWAVRQWLVPNLDLAAFVTLGPPALLLGLGAAGALFIGLSSHALRTLDREWAARAAGCVTIFGVVWITAGAAVLLAPTWLYDLNHWLVSTVAIAGLGALSGVVSALAAFKDLATPVEAGLSGISGKPRAASGLGVRLLGLLFLALLAVGLAVFTDRLLWIWGADASAIVGDWSNHATLLLHTGLVAELAWTVGFGALAWVMAWYININKFSLSGMYRERLIRAYLGASNTQPQPNRFTGFSANDDLPLHALPLGTEAAPRIRPFPVLNLTLNLVGESKLAWQQRKAESFTATPLACGSRRLGYRDARFYGGRGGITLGTAVALSGAAASPNMGYHSSPLLGFIMTLFNVRLGAWLGNPGQHGARTWRLAGPRSSLGALWREALGQTTDRSDYVYLSDGGHFENLGLYEMVQRRCHRIVVVDVGCDPGYSFEDLGNALRKIRIDQRVPIQFDEGDLEGVRQARRRCAVARIQYSAVDAEARDGELLYIKPVLLGTEAPDVASYARAHPTFPQQSTADQWFDESQTESYRILGVQSIREIAHQPSLATLLGVHHPPAAAAGA
ncbi:MAG: patatin-like phospholipase family protein [Terriglobales bacterium]